MSIQAMPEAPWKPEWTEQAQQFWREYQEKHDVSHLRGKVAAIDPVTGRVWIGDSSIDAIHLMDADGVHTPAWFVRVGYDYLYVKGRR